MEMMSSAHAEKILEPTGDEALVTESMSADLRQCPSASGARIATAKYMARNRSMLHKTEGAKLSQVACVARCAEQRVVSDYITLSGAQLLPKI